jgi:hypothetical protein
MMLLQILQHTPVWVWGLLVALVALGLAQARARAVSLTRLTILPLVMLALSFSGVVSTFAHATIAILAWAVGVIASIALGRSFLAPRGASWSPETGLVHVPGSWLPMALIVALFLIKYGVGVTLAMNHAMAADAIFGACCGFAYGGFSGLFAARALGLRRLASARVGAVVA